MLSVGRWTAAERKEPATGQDRIHRAVSDDGTEIAGRVYGQGPPVVLVHGSMADGEMDWGEMLPLLTGRFTCYLPSMRRRGLSGDDPYLSRQARVRDVTAFVDSIGEQVGLVALSAGGMLALRAAPRTSAINALAIYEPVVFEAMSPEVYARFRDVVGRMAEAAEEGRAAEAAGTFLELIANDEEQAVLAEGSEGLELVARYLPLDLEEFREAIEFIEFNGRAGAGPAP